MAGRFGIGPGRGGGGPWASLRVADYRRLWLAVVLANSGRWAFLVGVGWLVHTLVRSPFWVGASVFAVQGPAIVASPLAGVFADRFDRGRLLTIGLGSATAICALLWLAAQLHELALPLVLAASLAFGVAFTLQFNSWNALVPPIVPRPLLTNAVALMTTARQGSEFVGPLLATPILVTVGPGAVLGLCGLFYLAATLTAAGLPVRAVAAAGGHAQRFTQSLLEGVRYLDRNKPVRAIIPFIGLHCVLTMAYLGLLPEFVQVAFHSASQGYGDVVTAVGFGALAGGLAVASLPHPEASRGLFAGSVAASGLALTAFAMAHSLAAGIALASLVGMSQAFFMAWSSAFVQAHVDDEFRGRVSSLRSVLTLGTMSVGNWLWGALGVFLPPAWILGSLGVAFVIAAWAGGSRSDTLRELLRLRTRAAVTAPS